MDKINQDLEVVKTDNIQDLEVVKETSSEVVKDTSSEGHAVTQRRITSVEDQLRGLTATVQQLADMMKGNFPIPQLNTQVQHELPGIKESTSYTGGSQGSRGRSPLPLEFNSTQGTVLEETMDPHRKDSESPMTPSPSPVTERQMTNNELAEAWSKNTQDIVASIVRQKPALPTFSGGSRREYSIFIRRFHSYLQDNAVPASSKLDMLINACTGKLQDLLASFVRLGPKEGFDAAMKALTERLGSYEEHVDEDAWRLQMGPAVKDDDLQELNNLAYDMWECIIQLEMEKRLPTFDNSSCVAHIANRFTGRLKDRYTEQAHKYKKKNNAWPGIKWLLEMVDDHIVRLDRAITANQIDKEAAGGAKTDRPKQGSGSSNPSVSPDQRIIQLATVETGPDEVQIKKRKKGQPCYLCNGQHPIYACQQFRNMGIAERWAAVKRAQACYGCLGINHTIKECKSSYKVCDVEGCSRAHSKWLHRVNSPTSNSAQKELGSGDNKTEERGTLRVVSWVDSKNKRMKVDDSDS